MTAQFRDQLEQTLEAQREMLEAQRRINGRLDQVIEALSEVLATSDAVHIEDVPEAIQ